MSGQQVLAAVACLAVVAGLVLVGLGWQRRSAGPARGPRARRRLSRVALMVLAGVGAWLLTGWPALGLGVAVGVLGLPAILGADAREQRRIARVEAVEEWARRVADVLAIGVGLEQALQSAARTAPAAIQAEVTTLSARIAARASTEDALRQFADEVDDPAADLVVSALILATRRRGPGVAAAVTAIAGSVGEEVAARRRVEADRAKPRSTARAVSAITVIVLVVGLLNRGYTQPYSTPLGQAVLAATLAGFAGALWWMHSMTVTTPPERLLGSAQGTGRS